MCTFSKFLFSILITIIWTLHHLRFTIEPLIIALKFLYRTTSHRCKTSQTFLFSLKFTFYQCFSRIYETNKNSLRKTLTIILIRTVRFRVHNCRFPACFNLCSMVIYNRKSFKIINLVLNISFSCNRLVNSLIAQDCRVLLNLNSESVVVTY